MHARLPLPPSWTCITLVRQLPFSKSLVAEEVVARLPCALTEITPFPVTATVWPPSYIQSFFWQDLQLFCDINICWRTWLWQWIPRFKYFNEKFPLFRVSYLENNNAMCHFFPDQVRNDCITGEITQIWMRRSALSCSAKRSVLPGMFLIAQKWWHSLM